MKNKLTESEESLFEALCTTEIETIKNLINLGVDVNTEATINDKNMTPLVYAMSLFRRRKDKKPIEIIKIIKILLEAGANPNQKTFTPDFTGHDTGHYPLFISIPLFCPLSVVELLVEYRADINQINITDNSEATVLDMCYYGICRISDDDARRMIIEQIVNYLRTKGAKTIKELKGNKTNNTE